MTTDCERQEHRAWAQRVLGKPIDRVDRVTEEDRKAEIRAQVEAEVAAHEAQGKAAREREEGRRSMEHSMRHARAVTAPRDPRPDAPVGSTRKTADGTVWRREA